MWPDVAISCMADRHRNVPINIGNPGYTMLIGQYIVQILSWRLPRQSADWLAMTWQWVPRCADFNSSPNYNLSIF